MLTLRDFLVIEDSPEIFNFRFEFDGILMWPFIRYKLHTIPIFKEYELVYPRPSEKLNFIDKVRYLKNTIINNPFDILKTKYDILMFCSGITNVKKGDKYFNRVSEYFASLYEDKTLLIEDSARRKYYTPRSFPNVCYHDYIILEADIRSRFAKPGKKDITTIKSLLSFLEQNFPYKLERLDLNRTEGSLLNVSKTLNIYHYLYNKLFDKFNPKVIFLEDASYGPRSYILKWAKAREIVTIELQHGLVSKNHEAYNYGNAILDSDTYKEYLPDYFLTYGKYWSESINLSVKKITIGNPNYSENIKKINLSKKNNAKTKILFISGGVYPAVMRRIILEIDSMVNKRKYEISLRPHPMELPILEERYSEILARDKVKIDTEGDLYSALLSTDFVVGDSYSTVLFEAIGICKSVFTIDHPITDLHIPKNIIKRFSNAEELINLIQAHSSNNEIDKDYIWEPNWETNYKNFMDRLLGLL